MTNRREFLSAAALGAIGAGCCSMSKCGDVNEAKCACKKARRYALNPSTIREFKCSLKEQVKLCIEAGYQGIEPWLSDIAAAKKNGELADIRKMCEDGNLKVVNGIGFAHWSLTDKAEHAKGMEEMKRDMALVAELGGEFIAAPPFGLQKPGTPKVALDEFVRNYREVLELGDKMGVVPILEFWGHSANLSKLSEALYVASSSAHAKAAILADVYHMYRGASAYEGLRFCTKSVLPVLHMNDVPATPSREQLKDSDRVWPGDGIAPWKQIKTILDECNLDPWLSLELFNKTYQKVSAAETIKTGLAKMNATMA